MRVLLTGATGLIGSAILARLLSDGHDVVAVAHRAPERAMTPKRTDALSWVRVDMASARAEDWQTHLNGIEAVVNCAGVLQDSAWDHTNVHAEGATALFAACEVNDVRRVIHFSAIGVEGETPTRFSATKRRGDEDLMRRDLDWIVLRPSVVVGRAAYGGSALFRGLAALPVFLQPPHLGSLQIVMLDDIVRTVQFFLQGDAPARVVLDVAGSDPLSLADVIALYRQWLGWRPARIVPIPADLMWLLFKLGDVAGMLGWRSPMRSTVAREIMRGAVGDNSEWRRLTGIAPRSLQDALAAEPPSVQQRWFARLYLLKPVVFAIFAGFWIGTGLISLGPGYVLGVSLMQEGGAGALSGPSVIAGAIADIIIGLGIAFRHSAKTALYGAIALTTFYVVAGTLLLPRLWIDPLGPMWKIWPVLALNFVALAILDER